MVMVALRDVFETILHPQGRGVVSGTITRAIWRGMRRLVKEKHAALSLAGPLAFIAVLAAWGALIIVGFALILWPYFPEDFAVAETVTIDGGLDDAL